MQLLRIDIVKMRKTFNEKLNSNREKLSLVLLDFLFATIALWMAFSLRSEQIYVPSKTTIWLFLIAPFLAILSYERLDLYSQIIRYIDTSLFWQSIKAATLYSALFSIVVLFARTGEVARTVLILNSVFAAAGVMLPRLALHRWLRRSRYAQPKFLSRQMRRALIYGAGSAGAQVIAALNHSTKMRPIAFLDDAPHLTGKRIAGLKIYSPNNLDMLVELHGITDIVIAIPSVKRGRRREIISSFGSLPVKVHTLPSLSDIVEGKVSINDLHTVDVSDVLGRDAVVPDLHLMERLVTGNRVLVTGAGGSIGSELCRQIAGLQPASLTMIENSEFGLYSIDSEIRQKFPPLRGRIHSVLGSVLDQELLTRVINAREIDTIFHAAAYKHVPLVEANPCQGILNNVIGTWQCSRTALESGVKHFVLISTDKAVRPTNVMGASKRLSEIILQALQTQSRTTIFSMVRFGNVLGSSGSVVPLFRKQIRSGGPITVTHPEITRYFMTIPEAAQLVIQAGAMAEGGDVFILDMGDSIRIVDLAKRMIGLSGLTIRDNDHPDGDISIVFTGLRPGEKLYEELLIEASARPTLHPRIFRATERTLSLETLTSAIDQIRKACSTGDEHALLELLRTLIPEYNSSERKR